MESSLTDVRDAALPLRTKTRNKSRAPRIFGELEPGALLQALPAAVYTTDAAGRIMFYNEAAAALWGYRPELGKSEWCGSWRLYWQDGRPMPHDECPMAIALKERRAIRGAEAVAERPDGTRVPFLAYPRPLFDETGALAGAVNTLVDITDRKKAEVAAQRLAAIVKSSDDAIVSKDLNGIIATWNPGAERLFGYTAEEAIGKPVTILIPSDRQDEEIGILNKIRQGERVDHFETVRQHKDGSPVDISLTVSPIKNAEGKVIGASKIARDITDRKKAEVVALRLAAIVESSDDAIISKDLNGIITTWNRGAERLFGYAAEETIGKPVTILIPSDRQDEEPAILEQIRRGDPIEHYETIRQRKDGSLFDISLTVSPIKDANRRIIGASKIARDISERKAAQEQQRLIFREMNHRVKNLMTVASTMVTLSARFAATPSDLAEAVTERLVALARAHDLTLPDITNAEGHFDRATTLPDLTRNILAPYLTQDHAAVVVKGGDVPVRGKAAMGLALLLHELATNATKYGALTSEWGHVEVDWRVVENELKLTWRECGGPLLKGRPENEGFGSLLTRLTVTDHLGGKIVHDWNRNGLTVNVSAPLDRLME
jgi:PAS domain S-box-containing protein